MYMIHFVFVLGIHNPVFSFIIPVLNSIYRQLILIFLCQGNTLGNTEGFAAIFCLNGASFTGIFLFDMHINTKFYFIEVAQWDEPIATNTKQRNKKVPSIFGIDSPFKTRCLNNPLWFVIVTFLWSICSYRSTKILLSSNLVISNTLNKMDINQYSWQWNSLRFVDLQYS